MYNNVRYRKMCWILTRFHTSNTRYRDYHIIYVLVPLENVSCVCERERDSVIKQLKKEAFSVHLWKIMIYPFR